MRRMTPDPQAGSRRRIGRISRGQIDVPGAATRELDCHVFESQGVGELESHRTVSFTSVNNVNLVGG